MGGNRTAVQTHWSMLFSTVQTDLLLHPTQTVVSQLVTSDQDIDLLSLSILLSLFHTFISQCTDHSQIRHVFHWGRLLLCFMEWDSVSNIQCILRFKKCFIKSKLTWLLYFLRYFIFLLIVFYKLLGANKCFIRNRFRSVTVAIDHKHWNPASLDRVNQDLFNQDLLLYYYISHTNQNTKCCVTAKPTFHITHDQRDYILWLTVINSIIP